MPPLARNCNRNGEWRWALHIWVMLLRNGLYLIFLSFSLYRYLLITENIQSKQTEILSLMTYIGHGSLEITGGEALFILSSLFIQFTAWEVLASDGWWDVECVYVTGLYCINFLLTMHILLVSVHKLLLRMTHKLLLIAHADCK